MVNSDITQVIETLKDWFDESINTINGAADSDIQTLKLENRNGTIEITGRDKDMFLAGLKAAGGMFGKFPIILDTPNGEYEITTDSKRLQFLIENRYRVERWNTTPDQVKFYVYNDDDEVIAEAYTARESIDQAIAEHLEA
ncbi:hypothetical protein [Acinetobacter sp. CFCC 10889]|uniref:hypothetical protein n=1 Tax=Acinetobacter sp. CFCC 10889 TaxID=1775557 RepID=UPI000DCFC3D0|nr:hypothetical protein [Acinetobacter sp. CFCC 10889]